MVSACREGLLILVKRKQKRAACKLGPAFATMVRSIWSWCTLRRSSTSSWRSLVPKGSSGGTLPVGRPHSWAISLGCAQSARVRPTTLEIASSTATWGTRFGHLGILFFEQSGVREMGSTPVPAMCAFAQTCSPQHEYPSGISFDVTHAILSPFSTCLCRNSVRPVSTLRVPYTQPKRLFKSALV